MKRVLILIGAVMMFLSGCAGSIIVKGPVNTMPVIYPDYKGVTIPPDIAPMDFEVINPDGGTWALMIEVERHTFFVKADDGQFTFGRRFWKNLMNDARGTSMTFTLCVRKDDGWYSCAPFTIDILYIVLFLRDTVFGRRWAYIRESLNRIRKRRFTGIPRGVETA